MFTSDKFEGLGLAHKFAQAWLKADGKPSDLNSLADDAALLSEVIQICRGSHPSFVYRVDCDADPRNSEIYKIVEHMRQGIIEWKPGVVKLLRAEKVLGTERTEGGVCVVAWKHRRAANACVLDFLLKRPQAATEEMMDMRSSARFIFAGTRYHIDGKGQYASYDAIPALYWRIQHGDWGVKYMPTHESLKPNDVLVTLA
ncbi:MAG: hypothetical protein KBD06_03950 [Candidatus Pacebacteria bacterium]|nr:hypothetical protein [Candidatus Paceibacterota bacterium]